MIILRLVVVFASFGRLVQRLRSIIGLLETMHTDSSDMLTYKQTSRTSSNDHRHRARSLPLAAADVWWRKEGVFIAACFCFEWCLEAGTRIWVINGVNFLIHSCCDQVIADGHTSHGVDCHDSLQPSQCQEHLVSMSFNRYPISELMRRIQPLRSRFISRLFGHLELGAWGYANELMSWSRVRKLFNRR